MYIRTYIHTYIHTYIRKTMPQKNNKRSFFIDINTMPHYIVILHTSHNLSFSFTVTFTFNNSKTIVEVHYNIDNNILTSSLIIYNIYLHSLRSIYLSIYLSICLPIFHSKASLQIC